MEKSVVRKSNIELLRIIGMLMVLAHHFVVSSGIMDAFELGDTSINYIFLNLWGMWGKTAINIFVMISGFFMCTSDLTVKRYCKILFECLFYQFSIYLILLLAGYETIGPERLFNLFFGIFRNANGSGSFISSFLIFYLFIPFINIYVQKLTKKDFTNFLLLLLFVFTGLSTFFFNKVIFGEVFWFITVYLIGAYLRIYPPMWATSLKASVRFLIASLLFSYVSVLFMIFVGSLVHSGSPMYFFYDANKLGAVLVSTALLSTFKNLTVPYSKVINLFAKTTFGVLLIHVSSSAMRDFLWYDLLHVNTMSALSTVSLMINSVFICAVIYLVCSLIDIVRIFTVERWVFDHFDHIERYIQKIWEVIRKSADKICDKTNKFLEQ